MKLVGVGVGVMNANVWSDVLAAIVVVGAPIVSVDESFGNFS